MTVRASLQNLYVANTFFYIVKFTLHLNVKKLQSPGNLN